MSGGGKARRSGVNPWDVTLVLAVLALAYGAKSFASHAGPRELDFLLAPTAALVGALTRHDFAYESGAGYTSRELYLVIAPVCAGMNFLIIAFTALAATFVSRVRGGPAKVLWVLACAPVAYVATIVANAARITLGLTLGRAVALAGWLSAEDAHRAVGVAVYLGCLLGLHAFASAAFGRRSGSVAVPLASYVGVTVLAPLLRGAAHDPHFLAHSSLILGTAGAIAVVVWHLARSSSAGEASQALGPTDRKRNEERRGARAAAARADTVVDPLAPRVGVARPRAERPLPGQGGAALVLGAVR